MANVSAVRHCPTCASANPDDYRFCRQCGGTMLRGLCPACSAPHDADQPFCGQCGAPLTAPGIAPPGELAEADGEPGQFEERKLATVLFADVVGFTSLAERTDPETVARMVDSVFRQMATVVAEHGGTVDKYMGDCLMAVFGVPVAHEDDAARAVAAALAMSRLGGDLVFSIGINSGEVMATAMGGSGDVTVIGDAVNVAARLEKAAGPGQILCGPLTAELAGARAAFTRRKPIILKGKQGPVDVWEATALAAIGSRPSPDREPELIGRSHELAYLHSRFDTVLSDGRAQMVLVCGEAGSGKTRLLDELARSVGPDPKVVRAAHPPYGATGAQRLAAEVLGQLGPTHSETVNARVWSLAGKVDESLKDMDPSSVPHEQLWAIARLLEEKTAAGPLLLLLDDMHWSGESLLELLGNLRARVLHVPTLIVLAGRTDPGEWLQRFAGATTIRLEPLGIRESIELAAALVEDGRLGEEASDFLARRSAGNPLYLRELVRMARESGSLVKEGGQYRLGSTVTVPASLQAVLAARLDALPGTHKEVFQHVALLGVGTSVAAIGALGSRSAEQVLGDLVAAGLLRVDPDGGFTVAEPLLREVAYETLPFRTRSRLHRRAASAAPKADVRAAHLERAAFFSPDDPDLATEAAAAIAQAGMDYVEQSRLPEARLALDRAVELGTRQPGVLMALARLHEDAGNLTAAATVLGLVEDDPTNPTVALNRDHIAARLKMFADPETALGLLEAVADRWGQMGDQSKQAWAIANAGVAAFSSGRMDQAANHLDRARLIFENIDDQAGATAASSFLCLVRPADTRVPDWLVGALDFAERTGDRSKQVSAMTPLAWHHFVRTMFGAAEQTAEAERAALRLTELADELGVRALALQGRCLLLLAARYSGRLEQAAEQRRAMEPLPAWPTQGWLPVAASFVSTMAEGAADGPPPFDPPETRDPVTLIARHVVGAELLLGGRVDEALAYLMPHPPFGNNLQIEMSGVMTAVALVLSGRRAEARPWVERAERAAELLSARPLQRAAAAVRAEIDAEGDRLPDHEAAAPSVAEALVLRARAVLGDESCLQPLLEMVEALAAPGLLIGIPRDTSIRPLSPREKT